MYFKSSCKCILCRKKRYKNQSEWKYSLIHHPFVMLAKNFIAANFGVQRICRCVGTASQSKSIFAALFCINHHSRALVPCCSVSVSACVVILSCKLESK